MASFGFGPGVSRQATIRIFTGKSVEAEPVEATAAEAAPIEPVTFSKAVIEEVATELPMAVSKPAKAPARRRRARHPAGSDEAKPGSFIGNDPATPENEAWIEE
jgi:hypothetical protein